MPESQIWLLTWLAASVAFLSIPASVILVRAYRQLRRAGAPRPAVLLASRAASLFLPRRPASPADITAETVFVEWDLRWGASGQARAIATRSDRNVLLVFDSPQQIGTSGTRFFFTPNYRQGATVYGAISADGQVNATAVIRPLGV